MGPQFPDVISLVSVEEDSASDDEVNHFEETLRLAKNGDASTRTLQDALGAAHKKIIEQRTLILELRTKVADLSLAQETSVKSSAAEQAEEDIKKLGRFFQLFYTPFIDLSAFGPHMAPPDFAHDSPDRYMDIIPGEEVEANQVGYIAELFDCVPPAFHSYMKRSKAFPRTVIWVSDKQQSTTLSQRPSGSSAWDP
ncbi:hypothetical protein HYPSUDRAFT_209220 [Hypholoma sublateritium FD-334 SS-4]|uniref:Uncharacterized protein n=1 Tax=Hypholoma sublateritium (strain FD-334 SS-4) TaxID=945553 RepID=A0A0D2LSM6_HYPSF|nr:hypothetical protein HYPSUDRAFT_209220 [Hypholoma sublateritium FD-334 SS-4]